jgi:hypothetical protein
MIKNYPQVQAAHEADDLLFGTIDSWVLYVCPRSHWNTFHGRFELTMFGTGVLPSSHTFNLCPLARS